MKKSIKILKYCNIFLRLSANQLISERHQVVGGNSEESDALSLASRLLVFMLNSVEHKISDAHANIKKFSFFQAQISLEGYFCCS